MRAAVVLAGVVAVAGCSFDRAGLGAQGGSAADASTIDGKAGTPDTPPGTPDGMPDAMCTPSCTGAMLDKCDGNGPTTCDLGCSKVGGAHCEALVPSNGATDADDLTGVVSGLDVAPNLIFALDTDTGAIYSSPDAQVWTPVRPAGGGVMNGISYRQEGGLAVFGLDSLTIEASGYVRPYNNHAVVLLVRHDVAIAGYLDLSGGCTTGAVFSRACAGPGGGTGGGTGAAGMGCAGGGASVHPVGGPDSGGGGGGFGKDGGNGGDGDGSHKGGGGGKASACTNDTLVPLMGGGGGGGGGTGGGGGGGGGGVQITSLLGTITATTGSDVDAGGRGGAGTGGAGGGGGGAGGGILLEARTITLTSANVTSNGGGGGAGRNAAQTGIGGKGSINSTTPAAGGVGDATGGGGGNGGAGATDATNGNGPVDGGGGGGGAVGRIRFNVPAPRLTITGGVISPAQSRGDLTLQ